MRGEGGGGGAFKDDGTEEFALSFVKIMGTADVGNGLASLRFEGVSLLCAILS